MVKEYRIGDFLKRIKNAIEITDSETYKRVTIKANHQGVVLRDKANGSAIGTKSQFTIRGGDFILSKIDARYGAFGIIPEELDGAIITGNFWTYKVDTNLVDIEWFFYFTHSYNFLQICEESSTGTTHRKYLDEKIFLDHRLHLPEKEEQVQMVKRYLESSKVSSLCFSEIQSQKKILSKLKQGILQEAIQGKLTADWRAQNPLVEPASELLKRIKAEKEKLVKEKKIKKEKPLPPIKADEIPFELPEGWVWCRLGELFTSLQYGTSLKCSYSTEQNTPILRIPNVSSGFVSTTDLKFTNLSDKEKDQYSLQEGDLLIIRSNGSREITGSAVWVPKGFESYGYAGYLIRVRFLNEFIHTQYIQKYFCSTTLRVQIEAPLRTTVGINNINTTELSRLIIALPTLEEQDVIYSKVEKLFQKCQIFESQIAQSETHAQMLMQAVLKEAFEPTAATEPESEETIAIAAEPAEAFGKQGEFGF